MAIHVIQSQRIDVLVHALLTTVSQPSANPFQVLQTQHFIVPSKAVEVWLTQQLAEQKGISANTQFHHRIRGFQWAAYQWVLQDQKEQVRKANIPRIIIKWRVFQTLKNFIDAAQNPLTAEHPLSPIIQRIYDSADRLQQGLDKQLKKQRMLYWVADQVSRLFSNYMIYRGHCQKNCPGICRCPTNWLQAWGANQVLNVEDMFFKTNTEISEFSLNQARELEAWQRWLWQEVFHHDFQEMQQIDQQFWQVLADPATQKQALKNLPQRLAVFTLLDLPPSQLQFLRQLGQYIDIYILHYNPSQEYWADSVDPHWKARYDVRVKERFIEKYPDATDAQIKKFVESRLFDAEKRESRHPLLTRFGKQARDHFSLLSNLSSGEDGVWADAFVDDYPQTLLGKIQSDVLYLAEPLQHQYVLDEQDDSIQIHVCHSSLRQLEVLKDQLTHWLAQGSKAQPRRPSDILVLSPNLKALEPLIRSVFAPPPSERDLLRQEANHGQRLSQHSIYLPIKIAGVTQLDAHQAWRAVLGRIQLLQGRFTLEDFADWLGLGATQQRYALENASVERMVTLLTEAGFKRGFDAAHLQRSLSEGDEDYRFSFKFALDRLALGIAIPEHTIFQGTLSFAQVLSSDFELIGKLIQIYQDFALRRDWMIAHELGQNIPVEQWLRHLKQDVDEFQQAGVDALNIVADLIKKQERILSLAGHHDQHAYLALRGLSLPLPYLIEELNHLLEAQLEQAEPTGQITFSQMGQLRPLPYKLIVMLNLDSGLFPSRQQHVPFDLMDLLKPQLGDRSRLEDDQGAFLDALLLAQENVWLFYNGFDVNDGEVRDPSTVLQELIQHLALIVQPPSALTSSERVSLKGIEVAAQLQSLYRIHTLQPFDLKSFESTEIVRYQDQWFEVAQQIRHAKGQREAWTNRVYPRAAQEAQVLESGQWIQDVLFPARLYLKTLGIKNLCPQDVPEQQEPLLLNRLHQYSVRNTLLQQEGEAQTELFMDVLPIGKTQQATWQLSLMEQASLKQRLLKYAQEATVTTQQVWKVKPELYLNIQLPKQTEQHWVSVQASKAKAKYRARAWLEYLLWLAYLDLGTSGTNYKRIVVCHDKTIVCEGISSDEAKQRLVPWFEAWDYAQSQPLVLPAALLLEDKVQVAWEEVAPYPVQNIEKVLARWTEKDTYASYPYDNEEWNVKHRDWQFILQGHDAKGMLEQALQQFSYALYQPILSRQYVEE